MRKGSIAILMAVVLAVAVGVISVLGYQRFFAKTPTKDTTSQSASPTSNEILTSPNPTVNNETANWKIYINKNMGFLVKLPESFKTDEYPGAPTLYTGTKFTFPPNSPAEPYTTAITVYDRNGTNAKEACENEICQNVNNPAVGSNYKIENVTIGNASGVKITNVEAPLNGDYYLSDSKKVFRISYGTYRFEGDTRNDLQINKDFELLETIISTFKFE